MPAYDVLFDAAMQELGAQLAAADALDAKAATIFSVASTVAAVVPALLPLGRSGLEFRSWAFASLAAAGVFYVATLVLFYLAYRPGKWRSGPDMERLRQICGYGEQYARHWAADAYVLSIEATQATVAQKQRHLQRSIGTFVIEVVLLVGAAVATFVR